jgi:uncharacterized cupredoxin-like copper-binding protein
MKKILFVFITAGLMLGLLPRQVFAQKPQVTVTGTVVNEKNESIPGATVAVKGTTTGTITSTDGTFNVKAASDAVLSISFIGFKTVEVPVNGKTNLKITLQEDNKLMDEVVRVTNDDSTLHTFTLDDGSSSTDLPPGQTVTISLDLTKTESWHCTIHPPMTGTLNVA